MSSHAQKSEILQKKAESREVGYNTGTSLPWSPVKGEMTPFLSAVNEPKADIYASCKCVKKKY